MAFGGFQLFTDVGKYFDTAKMAASSITSDSAIGGFATDLFYGVLAESGGLPSFIRRALKNHGFIVDTVTKERLVFQYNVSARESGGADYAIHQVLARSVPKFHYKGGKERVLELPLVFTMQERARSDIRRSVRFLQGLAYPDYSNGGELETAPHPVVVVQGRLYSQDRWLVRDFNIQWGDAMDPVSQLPSEVQVNLTLVEIRSRAKTYNEVIRL